MPTYQYACTECGHDFERFQSFTDDALTECPTCGGRLRKVWGSVGIVFKGTGFYRNDSREATTRKDGADPSRKGGEASEGGGKDSKDSKDSKEPKAPKGKEKAPASKDGASSGPSGSERKAPAAGTSGSSSGSTTGSTTGSSSTAGSAA